MTDLPQGWREVALGDLVKVQGGFAYKSADWVESGMPVIRIGNVSNLGIDLTTSAFVEFGKAQSEERYGAKKGDVLLNMTGATLGAVGAYMSEAVVRINQRVGRLDIADNKALLSAYLLRLMQSPHTQKMMLDISKGAAQPNIAPKDVHSLSVLIPPLAEQERIVEILEEQFSRLDSALASIKAVREKSKAFRRSLLHAAFSGELTGGTEGWREVALGEIADVGWGDLKVTKNSYVDDGYTAYSATGPDGKLPYFDYDQTGIIVSAIGAQCGKVFLATGKWSCIKNTMRILSTKEEVSINYLFHLLSTDFLPKRGSGQPFIGQKDAREALVSIPPITTQERIVSVLEEQFSKLDKALEVANQLEARIASERRSLLHAAFTGELTSQWRKTHV